MPRGDVHQAPRGRVEKAVKEGDEAILSDMRQSGSVDPGAEVRGLHLWPRVAADCGLQVRHQQSGRNTFAGNVGDDDGAAAVLEREKIEEVAADISRFDGLSGHAQALGNYF